MGVCAGACLENVGVQPHATVAMFGRRFAEALEARGASADSPFHSWLARSLTHSFTLILIR